MALSQALIVGLNYTGSPYQLPDCHLDANNIEALALEAGYNVTKSTTTFVPDDMVRVLGEFAKASTSKSETLIMFSGHGTQWDSDSEPDGFDEGICLWDGKRIRVFTDDDFRACISRIKGSVYVPFDSCFSGGMAKLARRMMGRYADEWQPKLLRFSDDFVIDRPFGEFTPKSPVMSGKVYMMFASAEHQESISTGRGGLFTNAFVAEYQRRDPRNRTVGNIMNAAALACRGTQDPKLIIENGKKNKLIF